MTHFVRSKNCYNCTECNKKSQLTNGLNQNELDVLNEGRFEVVFKPNEVIYKQGTSATHMIFLTSGMAKIYIEGPQNKSLILKLINEGEFAGGSSILPDHRHHYTITAIKETSACFIPIQNWTTIFEMNQGFSLKFISHLNMQCVFIYDRMMSLTQKQMHGRMADVILYLSKEIFKSTEFNIILSRQDIADMTAMSKDSAIRVLKEFQNEGLIEENGKFFKILDAQKLENISQFG